ncbi:hypothetical protein [Streptacidiphilus cavernicola]|uniref:Uncharacterized protein n=1 Tax=Streptacidiphilus cavernicola TaxID=3342716 RepID=A0ABV6VYG3_9ACTN
MTTETPSPYTAAMRLGSVLADRGLGLIEVVFRETLHPDVLLRMRRRSAQQLSDVAGIPAAAFTRDPEGSDLHLRLSPQRVAEVTERLSAGPSR